MKIFISSDMEGTAGVVDWEQCRPGGADYPYYRELLQGEVNAAIEGARDGGAEAFLVNDSHGRMANLRPGDLPPGTTDFVRPKDEAETRVVVDCLAPHGRIADLVGRPAAGDPTVGRPAVSGPAVGGPGAVRPTSPGRAGPGS